MGAIRADPFFALKSCFCQPFFGGWNDTLFNLRLLRVFFEPNRFLQDLKNIFLTKLKFNS